jgi:hypothetical protein
MTTEVVPRSEIFLLLRDCPDKRDFRNFLFDSSFSRDEPWEDPVNAA